MVWKLLKRCFRLKTRKFAQKYSSGAKNFNKINSRYSSESKLPHKNSKNSNTSVRNIVARRQKETSFSPPPVRPGQRGNTKTSTQKGPNLDRKQRFLPCPELICREVPSSQSWEIFLSVSNKECSLEEVRFEGGNKLNSVNQEYGISSLRGRLVVTYQDERKPDYIPLFEEGKPLIFKLQKNWQGDGRQVSRVTKGYFIIITPNMWKRKGCPPIEPFNCMGTEFQGHYWDASKSNEDSDGFAECVIPSSAPIMKLIGPRVFDDSEEGDFFVNNVPTLEVFSQEIAWAQVGEETKGGWKGDNFEPHKDSLSKVLGNQEGWFFLRIYDKNRKMVDSVSFRYLQNLKQIFINDEEYTKNTVLLPTPDGYLLTKIRFVDACNITMSPQLLDGSVCTKDSSGILEIPACKDADHISCTLDSPSGNVNVVLKLPRVWWRIESDTGECNEWRDVPFDMTRQKFSQLAKENARICLSSQKFNRVPVGFDEVLDQKCNPYEIFLDYFSYHDEIRTMKIKTCLNIEWGNKTFPLIRICADKPREIISARVRRTRCAQCGCEWRNGKGFSRGEIENAKLTVKKAKSQFIPVDKRRKSSHPVNVKKIQEALNVR